MKIRTVAEYRERMRRRSTKAASTPERIEAMSMAERVSGYIDQTGRQDMTPRQQRRAYKKYRQAMKRYELAQGAA